MLSLFTTSLATNTEFQYTLQRPSSILKDSKEIVCSHEGQLYMCAETSILKYIYA